MKSRFKQEKPVKVEKTDHEKIMVMLDKRLNDVYTIIKGHGEGLDIHLIASRLHIAESYVADTIQKGFDKKANEIIDTYGLTYDEITIARKNLNERFNIRPKITESIITEMTHPIDIPKKIKKQKNRNKQTLVGCIIELAKEFQEFTPQEMTEAFEKNGFKYKKKSITDYMTILNINASEGLKKAYPSIYKYAFLIKMENRKYKIAKVK